MSITIYSGSDRLYVWQFASFPADIIVYKHKGIMERFQKYSGGLFFMVALIMVVLKKTLYAEMHEMGVADTLLQIGVTWCLSLFMFCGIE